MGSSSAYDSQLNLTRTALYGNQTTEALIQATHEQATQQVYSTWETNIVVTQTAIAETKQAISNIVQSTPTPR